MNCVCGHANWWHTKPLTEGFADNPCLLCARCGKEDHPMTDHLFVLCQCGPDESSPQ